MAFENNDYFTFGPPIIGGGYGGTYGGGIYGQIATAAETLPPGPVVPGAMAQPAPAPEAPPNPQIGVTELPPPSSNDPAPLPNPLGETAEEVFETFPPGVFPELYPPPFPFPEIEADYRRYTEENFDLYEFCGDYGIDPVDCALIGNSDPLFGPGALEPDRRDVDTRTQDERWRDELRIPPLMQLTQPRDVPPSEAQGILGPILREILKRLPKTIPKVRPRRLPRRRTLPPDPRRRRPGERPIRRPEPPRPLPPIRIPREIPKQPPRPEPRPLPLPPPLPGPVPRTQPEAPTQTPPDPTRPDTQPRPFGVPPFEPDIPPLEVPPMPPLPSPSSPPSPSSRPAWPFTIPFVIPWPSGSPRVSPFQPFSQPAPAPSSPPLPSIDAGVLPFGQPQTSNDPCNCRTPRKRRRKCHARAPVRWAGGPKKGKLAGSRCYAFQRFT